MKRLIFILFLINFAVAGWSMPTVEYILGKLETNMSLLGDTTSREKMTQTEVGEGTKVKVYIHYRRDERDAFMMICVSPDIEKGNGYLRVDDNMWKYNRNTRTFEHISEDDSIGGTHAKARDFGKQKFIDMWDVVKDENGNEKIAFEMLGKTPTYAFELIAKDDVDITYPKQKMWVDTNTLLPVKMQSYSLSGTLMRTIAMLKFAKIGQSYMPMVRIMIDEFEKGNQTIVQTEGISTKELGKEIFTKAYLENLSQ